MSKSGIFNPYVPPPTQSVSRPKDYSLDRGISLAEEAGLTKPKPSIRLDGGSYILELNGLELKEVPQRLGSLIKEVIESHPTHMLQQGIQLMLRGSTFDTEEGELVLPTPLGHLLVYVGLEESNEDAAYRRIAHALVHLPIRKILDKHQARIIVRS